MQVLPRKRQCKRNSLQHNRPCLQPHEIAALTDALGVGEVDCPSSVARDALGSTAHRAMRAGLRHSIVAKAHIGYKMMQPTSSQSAKLMDFCKCDVQIHSVLSWLIVHPVLHDAHIAAAFTRQTAPVSATPFLHVHELTTT